MFNLKLIQEIGRLSKKKLTIEASGQKPFIIPATNKVSISPSFFRHGACQRCGRSCNVGFDLFWTKSFDFPKDLIKVLKPYPIKINGQQQELAYYKNPRNTPRCDFVKYDEQEKAECLIHEFKPVHCMTNPIFIDTYKGGTNITKRTFKRNHLFGCKIQFEPFNYKWFIDWDIKCLEKLHQSAKDLGIPTYLPDVLDRLNFLPFRAQLKQGILPKESIIIYQRKKLII